MLARRILQSSAASVFRAGPALPAPAVASLRSIRLSSSASSSQTHEAFRDQDPNNKPGLADDPWAIPLQNPAADPEPNDIPLTHPGGDTAHPEGRDMNEPTETLRSRLVYQSRKRGTLEMEMLCSTFIDAGKLKNMSREDMQEYDRLLTLPDWTIYYWAIGKKSPPEDSEWANSKVLAELKQHSSNEHKELRKMPEISSYGINSVAQS